MREEWLERVKELGPDFLLAWAGWLVHSLVHTAGHSVTRIIHRLWGLFR